MKGINELLSDDPAWPVIENEIRTAKQKVTVLKCQYEQSYNVLYGLQITTHSIMGSIAYYTGGIIINDGMVRILGAGNNLLKRNLLDWNVGQNKILSFSNSRCKHALLVADDIFGGFFAVDYEKNHKSFGKIIYMPPESLDWDMLDINYPELINWFFTGDVKLYYKELCWDGFLNELRSVSYDEAYCFSPYLWKVEEDNSPRVKEVLPIEKIWNIKAAKMNW